MAERVPSSGLSHAHTVDMIEADILAAQAALERLGDDANASRSFTARRQQAQTSSDPSDTVVAPAVTRPASISETRRREILAKLASERVELRGFASDREARVVEASADGSQQRQQSQTVSNRMVSRNPEDVNRAVQDAAAAAVSSALDRAMASLSRGNGGNSSLFTSSAAAAPVSAAPDVPALLSASPQRVPPPASPLPAQQGNMSALAGRDTVGSPARRHEQVITTAQQWEAAGGAGASSFSSPGGDTTGLGRQAKPGGGSYASQSKQEKEQLIAQLLAERRAKLGSGGHVAGGQGYEAEAGRYSYSSSPARSSQAAASIPIPTMPAVPPIVAQLQAQAKLAAETAARAAEAAAHAALQQTLVERTIAEQRRQLEEVAGGRQQETAPAAASSSAVGSPGRPVPLVASPPPATTTTAASANTSTQVRSPRGVKVTSPHTSAPAGQRSEPPAPGSAGKVHGEQHPASATSAGGSSVGGVATGGPGEGGAAGGGAVGFKRPSKAELAAERESKLYGECTFRPAPTRLAGGRKVSARTAASSAAQDSALPRAHASRLAELARTKSEQWEALQRKKLEEEEQRMRSECTFQPNASVDPSRGVVVSKDGRVLGAWPGRDREGSAGADGRRPSSRSKSPGGHVYHAEDLLSQPPGRAAASRQPAPASSSSLRPAPALANQGRQGAGEAQAAAARANALTQGSAPAPSPPRSYQRPFVPAGSSAAQAPALPASSATAQAGQATARARRGDNVQLESPLRWEKSKAKQYVDGPGFVVARLSQEPAVAPVPPPPVPPAVPPARTTETQGRKAAPPAPTNAAEQIEPTAPVPAVAQRLFAEADARATKRARAKAALEQKAIAQYTFKPNLNPNSLALVNKSEEAMTAGQPSAPLEKQRSKPLHERSAALARAHEQYLHRLRVEANLANKDITFKPKLNPVSEHLASAQAALKGLPSGSERLVAEAVELEARRQAARRAAAEAEAEAHPFAPKTLPASQRILEKKLQKLGLDDDAAAALSGEHGSAHAGTGPGDAFLARQAVLSELSKKRRASIVKDIEASDPCTFRPDIGNADEILALTRPDRVTEGQEERVHRLAKEEAQAQAAARAKREEEYYSKFSYKPALNSNSLARARSKTSDERSKNEGGARRRLRAQAQADAQFQQEHPFQPTLVAREPHAQGRRGSKDSVLSGPHGSVASLGEREAQGGALRLAIRSDPEHVSERIKEYEKSKAAKLEAARKLAEYEAMAGCTFAPDTGASKKSHAKVAEAVAADGGVVVVRGLGRHLELRELSRKLEEEKREREAEAFAVKGVPSYDDLPPGQAKPPTVPEPFHLSTAETAPLIAARHHAVREAGHTGHTGSHGAGVAREGRGKANARAMLHELLDRDTTVLLAQPVPHGQQPGTAASKPSSRAPPPPAALRTASRTGDIGDMTQGINITRM